MSKKETDPYVESEKDRIDGLIKELRAERRRIINEKDEEPQEISDTAQGRAIRVAMGYFINAILDGKRERFAMEAGVPTWGKHAAFNIHGLWDLDHEQLSALASTEYHSDTPEDGNPVFSSRVVVCDRHINCMILEVEVYFSDNDWKTLTEDEGRKDEDRGRSARKS